MSTIVVNVRFEYLQGGLALNQQYEDEFTIDLRDIFRIVRKRIALVLLIPFVAVVAAALVAMFVLPEVYQASTTLIVGKAPTQQQIVYNDIMLNRQLVKTYKQIAHSNKVMEPVIRELKLDLTPERLRSAVDVTQLGDTEIIKVSVEHTDPYVAMVVTNSVARSFIANIVDIMQVDNVSVVDEARLPQHPIKPQKKLIVAVAGVLGLMSSLLLVFLLEYLDNTIKTPTDVERYLDLPVLAAIPRFRPGEVVVKGE